MVGFVTFSALAKTGLAGPSGQALSPVYGTLAWSPEIAIATPLVIQVRGGKGGAREFGRPALARGETRPVLGGAGRIDARGVTLGADGTITLTDPRQPLVCTATVTLAHANLTPSITGDSLLTSTLGLHLYRNGSQITGASVYHDVTNVIHEGTPGYTGYGLFALTAVVEFKATDVASLWVSNQSGAHAVTVVAGTFTLHSV